MAERLPPYILGLVRGLGDLGIEPPAKLLRAERTRAALEKAHREAQVASAGVSTVSLRDRFTTEAIEAAEAGTEMPNHSQELAKLEAEQRWRGIAVEALDDAITRAGYGVIAAVDGSMDEIYLRLRRAWAETIDKIRSIAPAASTLPLESPESILRSGDRRGVDAFATLSDASDALAKIGTVQRHLREAQNGRDEASARFDHFADPNVARRAPKHRLSYALWLVSSGVNPVFRTVAESREMQAKADAIQGGRRAIAQASAGGAVVVN
jgi:hypothetical protein